MSMLLFAAMLVTTAGEGRDAHGSSDAQPITNPGTWIGTDDYPKEEWSRFVQGSTRFTLKIDAEGKVVDCVMTETSGSEGLDEATCTLRTARGLFRPAKDADGHPIEGRYSSVVRWQIPFPPPIVPEAGQAEFDVDTDGKASSCIGSGSQRNPWAKTSGDAGATRWCDEIVKRPYTLLPTKDGRRRPQHVTLKWSVELSDPKPPN